MRTTAPALTALALLAACGGGDGENGPPLILGPAGANTFDDLVLTVVDGKEDRYTYTWQVEGEDEPRADLDGLVVPADLTEKGQTWTVTASRGGRSSTANLTVGNAPPRAEVTLNPVEPTSADEITATGTGIDPDGDPTFVEYAWQRRDESGKWEDFGVPTRTISAQSTRVGQEWRVRVTPVDGDSAGNTATLTFRIVNAPPVVERVQISATEARTNDVLSVVAQAMDPDAGDTVRLEYRWLRNGTPIPDANSPAIDGTTAFDAGDQVWVEVRGNDGETPGEWRASQVASILNSPPGEVAVAISPEAPFSDEDLICRRTTEGEDPDGDPVSYRARWLVDGAPFTANVTTGGLEGDTVPAAFTNAEETWTCQVVAFDDLGAEGVSSANVFVDARSGCADGTTEVEWSIEVEGCLAAEEIPWSAARDNPGDYCADGWGLAGADIVNTQLNGTAYTDAWNFAFNGEGCEGQDAFATTPDGSTTTRRDCLWRKSHQTRLSSETSLVDGVVCQQLPEETPE